ncbi:MAG: hypothetical protein JXB50_13260 [Spirochaetes bacterium]|nr:hypothetical protein [Spirochaetota bacterium]
MKNIDLRKLIDNKIFIFYALAILLFLVIFIIPKTDKQNVKYAEQKNIVKLNEVSKKVDEHTAWNKEGNTLFTTEGLTVMLDKIYNSNILELTIDNNDDYFINFIKDENTIGTLQIKNLNDPNFFGLRLEKLSITPEISKTGFNKIQIVPITGDNMYSLGHIRLL